VAERVMSEINTSVAHPARVYDYWLGGKDNFPADRELGDQVMQVLPGTGRSAQANRAFMVRAARSMAEAGVRQFIDIGTGLPTSPNLHEITQTVAPEARVVYVDNDPIVLVHARALLTSSPKGRTGYVDADIHNPEKILREAAGILDFSQPVGLTLIAILHYVADDDPWGIVRQLVAGMPSGSYLAVSHATIDIRQSGTPEQLIKGRELMNQLLPGPFIPRTHAEVSQFFDGLELLAPGVVQTTAWRPDPGDEDLNGTTPMWCGVARKR